MKQVAENRSRVIHPLGVLQIGDKFALPYVVPRGNGHELRLMMSGDASHFTGTDYKMSVQLKDGTMEQLDYCTHFSGQRVGEDNWLTYLRREGRDTVLVWAKQSADRAWVIEGETVSINEPGILVGGRGDGEPLLIYGDGLLKIAQLGEAGLTDVKQYVVAAPRAQYFDGGNLLALLAVRDRQGIFVLYDCSYRINDNKVVLQLGSLLLDAKRPNIVLWRSEMPLFEEQYEESGMLSPVGAVLRGQTIQVYWEFADRMLVTVEIPNPLRPRRTHRTKVINLVQRHEKNPILEPRSNMAWEAAGTFNPAAIK